MAVYIIPILLGVAVLFGGVVAFLFSKALRSAPGLQAKLPAAESSAARTDRPSHP